MARWVLLGNLDNRRVAFFEAALEAVGEPVAERLALGDALTAPDRLAHLLVTLPRPVVVRLESPGEDFAVTRRLLAMGAVEAEAEGGRHLAAEVVESLEHDLGRILYPRQWFLGYRAALRAWSVTLAEAGPGVFVMNAPEDIEVMFDKTATCEALASRGIPVPPWLGPVTCYEGLCAAMDTHGVERAFVKLLHGSSASGVIAFSRLRNLQAITSMSRAVVGGEVRFYNSLRLSMLRDEREIAEAVDFVLCDGGRAEAWVPKGRVRGRPFDVRVVVIGGEARHAVVRIGRTPLTNLHLGNERGEVEEVEAQLGAEAWRSMLGTCEAVAGAFPRSLYAGVDLATGEDEASRWIIEANAFGDLLPNVVSRGVDTYRAEVEAMLRRVQAAELGEVMG